MSTGTKWLLCAVAVVLLVAGVAPKVQAQMIYVSPNGTNDVAGNYGTWEGAATNISEAVVLANSLVRNVTVSNGTYAVTNTLLISVGITVQGVGGPQDTVIARSGSAGFTRVFDISSAGAMLSAVTVSNGYEDADGGGILMSAGTVSNCVVTDCKNFYSHTLGAGIYMSGGLVTRCVLKNNASNKNGSGAYVAGGELRESQLYGNTTAGALYVTGAGSAVRRCTIRNNTTSGDTVTAGGGTIENCLVVSNSTTGLRGGVYLAGGRLVHCTIADNSCPLAGNAGGVELSSGSMTNCIVYRNLDGGAPHDVAGTMSLARYSCAPELTYGVNGNTWDDPKFVDGAAGNYRLAVGSPCVDRGTNITSVAEDLEGTTRPLDGNGYGGADHDMGAYEAVALPGGTFEVSFTPANGPSGLEPFTNTFAVNVFGADTNIVWYGWDTNSDGSWDLVGGGLGAPTFVFGRGRHTITLRVTNSTDQAAECVRTNVISVFGTDIYVATNGASSYPYASWDDAATNIHDALDMAVSGCTVHVGDGRFAMVREHALSAAIAVESEGSGPSVLYRSAGDLYRLFTLSHAGALLSGVVVSNGYMGDNGGGILLSAGTVSNCVVTDCRNYWGHTVGAGIYISGGLVTRCVLKNNISNKDGSGAYVAGGELRESELYGNTAAGALYVAGAGSAVRRCTIRNNTTSLDTVYGGSGMIENCLMAANATTGAGRCGGVNLAAGRLINCTVVSNRAPSGVGGVVRANGSVTNCILYFNSGSLSNNYSGSLEAVAYSCAPELTDGFQGNLAADPRFAGVTNGNFRLQLGSPCLNKGYTFTGMEATVDLDGQPRVKQGAVDIGAYELPPALGTILELR